MNQLVRIWTSLSRAQQISLILIPLAVCASVLGLLKWRHDTNFRVLYSGLAPEDASAVTQKIREAGIEFRLDEMGASVLVPAQRVADARLALAGAGLPRSGRIGFELFDRTNLGASDFAEQVNYRRALEGELERTVATLSEVDQARIHITFAKDSVFLDTRQPSKATVVLRLRHSGQLSQPNVVAIANLVASAVDGLSPESVAVIDGNGRLLSRPRPVGGNDAQLAEANLDYRRQVESELLAKINLALTPLLGADRFRASVDAECDFTSSEENQESVDPARSVMLTSQTTEESSGSALAGGTPGTASNLPRPAARASSTGPGLTRHTENTTYQPSRSVKRIVTPKGAVRRISAAVLVDQTVRWDGVGPRARRTLVPPSAEVLKGVHDVIAGIIGFTEQRGDAITVETLPFEATLQIEPPPGPAPPAKPAAPVLDFKSPQVVGAGVLIVLLTGAIAFLLFRRRHTPAVQDTLKTAIQQGGASRPAALPPNAMQQQLSENEALQAQIESEMLSKIKLPANTKKTEVLMNHIRDSVQKDASGTTNVLRTWISEPDTKRIS
ncbi:MAG: flagellar M-ring protein FliF [Acidobacteriota bacterium]|nr:flagellar M-ring protein FliF [Acidobacteriota bacterium]